MENTPRSFFARMRWLRRPGPRNSHSGLSGATASTGMYTARSPSANSPVRKQTGYPPWIRVMLSESAFGCFSTLPMRTTST